MVNGNRELKSTARAIQEASELPYTEALAIATLRAEQPVITIEERDGVKLQLTFSDSTHPYAHEEVPVYAQIELPDGTVVMAFDYGAQGTFTFVKDNVTVTSDVWPMWYPASYGKPFGDEVLAAELISSAEFRCLEDADEFAAQFSEEEMQKRVDGGFDAVRAMTTVDLHRWIQKVVAAASK